MWARRGSQGCEQEPEKFEHTVSIADLRSREVLPPHSSSSSSAGATTTIGVLSRASILFELTSRERDVLGLVARGLSNAQIGQEMHLSPGTIKNHVLRLRHKIGAVNRMQAAVLALELGLIESADAAWSRGPAA